MNIPKQLLFLLESLNHHKNNFTYNETKANFVEKNLESRFEVEHAQISFDIDLNIEKLDSFSIEGKANFLVNFDFEKVFKPSNFRKFFLDQIDESTFQERIVSRLCNNIDTKPFSKFDSDPWIMLHEQACNINLQFFVYDKILKVKTTNHILWEKMFIF